MSDLRDRLTRAGVPWREADPPPIFTGAHKPFRLSLSYPFDQPVPAIERLRQAGLSLLQAKSVVDELTDTGVGACRIADGVDITQLTDDLARLNITVAVC